jgi:aspartyl aminopeptidase
MCILADKEETGSDGASGMQSDLMLDIINEIALAFNISPALLRAKSKCLSADVCAGFDPNFPEVFEKMNSAFLGCGAVFTKYTGGGGKYDTNDANAEFVAWLRAAMEKDNVVWQSAELGKVDAGGGGTVAKYISKHNIETIDLGVPLLAMHAPYELAAKVDVYETHRAVKAFYNFD